MLHGLSTGQRSPFNDLEISSEDSENYTFLVGGHFHGSSGNHSGFPAASLLANLDRINDSGAAFLVSLGDLFLNAKRDQQRYETALFAELKLPLFNVVGNHDVEDFNYSKHYGKTSFTFAFGQNQFIFLDTERDNGDIEGGQLKELKKWLKSGASNYFVFAHRPIWAEDDPKLEDVFKGNTSSGTNYSEDVLPALKKADGHVYFFGGSIGGEAPVSFFYHEKTGNITYIATAIRDLIRDGILQVTVKGGQVSFTPISFTGQKLQSLESYNLSFWNKNHPDDSFNWRLVPLYLWQMVGHRFFWYGMLWTLGGLGGFWLMRRWWRKRRRKA